MSAAPALRVLCVDDEASHLQTLAANLELEGFEVVAVTSGAEALARVSRERFDVVLSDIRMPQMTGADVLRGVRKIAPDMPVILMTGFATDCLVGEVVRDGAFTVFSKPFPIDEMIRTLFRAGRRPAVVLVDESREAAEATANALCAVGIRAQLVSDADLVLDLVERGDVDVCVVELDLSRRSGPELIRELHAKAPRLVLIAISGDRPDLIRRAAASGAQVFLRKPWDAAALLEVVARARATAGGRP